MAPGFVKNKDKTSVESVIANKRICSIDSKIQCPRSPSTVSIATVSIGERYYGDFLDNLEPIPNPREVLRQWVQKKRFFPQDLSDDFLEFFLTACSYNLDLAKEKLQIYFTSRQEPSPLFRDRDPLSPENMNIFEKLYVMPVPETTADGKKIILTGAVKPQLSYNQMDHAKALAMIFDLLIWEKDFGFGDYVIVFDGRGFPCPQLLENRVHNHTSIRRLLQDAIPGRLRSFYFLYPPPYVAKVADSRNGLWITVVKSKREMLSYLSADSLPLEYGGNLGHLGDLLEQWKEHIFQNREFFVEFEKRMTTLYERRMCYEEEIKKWGKDWVQHMKLVDDEWEYKKKYYARMKCMAPLKHPAFGSQRLLHVGNKTVSSVEVGGPCREFLTDTDAFKGLSTVKEFSQEIIQPQKKESGRCIVLPVLEFRTFCS